MKERDYRCAGKESMAEGGNAFTCGLRKDGMAACWGEGASGQTSPPAP